MMLGSHLFNVASISYFLLTSLNITLELKLICGSFNEAYRFVSNFILRIYIMWMLESWAGNNWIDLSLVSISMIMPGKSYGQVSTVTYHYWDIYIFASWDWQRSQYLVNFPYVQLCVRTWFELKHGGFITTTTSCLRIVFFFQIL